MSTAADVMLCDFDETIPGRLYTCKVCHFPAKTSRAPSRRKCAGHPPVKTPGLGRKVMNFAGSMVTAALDGFATVTPEQTAARLEICSTCDRYDVDTNQCLKCGCPLSWKPTLRSTVCPLGKWPRLPK